jgi:hypothetical protein
MSLDTYKLHRLQGKEFNELYTNHAPKWKKMVEKSVEHVRACVGEHEKIKAGDVIAAVQHGIKISGEFEHHLTKNKLTQQYWSGWFAEYVVEQIFPHAEIKTDEGEK